MPTFSEQPINHTRAVVSGACPATAALVQQASGEGMEAVRAQRAVANSPQGRGLNNTTVTQCWVVFSANTEMSTHLIIHLVRCMKY